MTERTQRKSGPSGPYRHLIGGEAFGTRHKPGDRVDPSVPASKLKQWLDAGIIEPDKQPRKETDREHSQWQRESS